MKKVVILFTLIISVVYSYAQTGLQGKVTSGDNKSLANASVVITELQKGTLTDDNGSFTFSETGKGVIHLQVSLLGYKTVVRTVDLAAQTGELAIQLEASALELKEVVVTSNNTNLEENIPFAVNTFSLQELHEAAQPTLMQMLARQPGIDRISVGNGIGKPVIRGLSFNRILLYTMGTRVENQQWDDRHDLGIVDYGLDNVEVVYGPSALIYGADALGGALIFTDEKPAPNGKTVGSINLGMFSNTLGINGDVGIKGTTNKGLFYMVRVGGESHTNYMQGDDEEKADTAKNEEGEEENFAANSKFMNYSAKAAVGLSKKWGVSKLSYSYLHALTGMIEIEDSAEIAKSKAKGEDEDRDREMEAPYQDVSTHIASWENTLLLGPSRLNINLAYQFNDRKEFEPAHDSGATTPDTPIFLKLNTCTYDVKWTSNPEKKFGITVGTQGMYQTNRNFGGKILVPDASVTDFEGYAVIRFDPSKQWNLLGGVRYDMRQSDVLATDPGDPFEHEDADSALKKGIVRPDTVFTKKYTPVSFSAGAAWHPVENFTVKANVATGFSAPNYGELSTFGTHEATNRFEVGNSNLKVIQNVEADLGILWEMNHLSLFANGYYNMIKDYIYITPTIDTIGKLQVYDYVQSDAVIAGGSVGIDIHPASLKWLDLNSTFTFTSGTLNAGGNLPYVPANKIITELRLMKESIWKMNKPYISLIMDNHFAQDNVAKFETATEGYTLFDVRIGADIKWGRQTVNVMLFGTNIFNTSYFNNLSLIKSIGVHEMGQNFGLQVHVPFAVK